MFMLTCVIFFVSIALHDCQVRVESGQVTKGAFGQDTDPQDVSEISNETTAEEDYPDFREIPKTGFTCRGRPNWGYYADTETGCQVFHVCQSETSKTSFLCPKGSIFSQRHLICDWWYNVDCSDSDALAPNLELLQNHPFPQLMKRDDDEPVIIIDTDDVNFTAGKQN